MPTFKAQVAIIGIFLVLASLVPFLASRLQIEHILSIAPSLLYDDVSSIAAIDVVNTFEQPQHQSQELPKWIKDYVRWHQQMRAKYPGTTLITDPNAPPILVRICLGLCGGLHDRLGQLPIDLYIANQTKRVLLIKWIKPQPLQEFLVPPLAAASNDGGIDWTFPDGVEGWGTNCDSLNECAKQVRLKPTFSNIGGGRKEEAFATFMDQSMYDLTEGKYSNTKAVTFAIMAHLDEDYLEGKLKELGETDMIHDTPTFGNIWHKFFIPHPNVQKQIDDTNRELGLIPGEYSLAHCRVRHPKAYPSGLQFENGEYIANADKTGLPFVGRFKDLAVEIALLAIQCAATLPDVVNHPIYFASDSSDLVTYLTRELTDEDHIQQHKEWFTDANSMNATALKVMTEQNIVARYQDFPNAHIDKNKGRPAEAYYSVFVDLYLGMNARCVSFGIGNYAVFAGKLSGTSCTVRYAREEWGEQDRGFHKKAKICELPQQ